MIIHREAGVYTSPYPCPQFMEVVGIWEDYQVLLSNPGLNDFLTDEPTQFAKLTMGVVQDFKCNLSSANPMVQYKIYNHTIYLPFDNFFAAIRVPQWGSRGKIKQRPEPLMRFYKDICGGRRVEKFEAFIFHAFGILLISSPNVFLLRRYQASCLHLI